MDCDATNCHLQERLIENHNIDGTSPSYVKEKTPLNRKLLLVIYNDACNLVRVSFSADFENRNFFCFNSMWSTFSTE